MKKVKIIVSAIVVFILAVTTWYIIAVNVAGGTPQELIEKDKPKGPPLPIEMPSGAWKPIIYLYPEKETKASVTLSKSENITCSYPKYTNDGWDVLVQPNGDMTELDTNKELYALYYEMKNSIDFEIEDDGFVVKSENIATFLEEKLAILGLTPHESEEFIIYWLPQLEENPYTYIRFATADEIEQNMPLIIEPTPDTTIRILMTFKGLSEPIEVEEQQLEPVERKGFVAVEWGATKL